MNLMTVASVILGISLFVFPIDEPHDQLISSGKVSHWGDVTDITPYIQVNERVHVGGHNLTAEGYDFPIATGRFWQHYTPSLIHPGHCPYRDGAGWTNELTWPTQRRTRLVNQFEFNHPSIDILAPTGTPVYAASSGVVVWAGLNYYLAQPLVALSHGDQWRTYYEKLSEVYVECGDYVYSGQLIGLSGGTHSSTPSVGFRVEQGFDLYDPMTWLNITDVDDNTITNQPQEN